MGLLKTLHGILGEKIAEPCVFKEKNLEQCKDSEAMAERDFLGGQNRKLPPATVAVIFCVVSSSSLFFLASMVFLH